ncbi:hypothetical protein TNCT_305981 [Trichonephila clavata]|uniref:Uncharacterized protein n=1 Tax=Trichonephila clavata TaxID=2740835 RepID=A0A8X6KX45_TRICU|nr:hypothetical protein TNCT_305981 [Trichonephila clavata]
MDTDAFSRGMDKARFLKKIPSLYPTKQTYAPSTEIALSDYSKYEFYDNNGEKFIIDKAEFEEEEKKLIDIFCSNSEILPNLSQNKIFRHSMHHFIL